MNIVVCIKQVPGTTEVKMNKETNTIIREGVASIINPFDLYAIEEALRLREKTGGSVTVLSMGIPSVTVQLKEALAMGADNAVLLSDRAFAGSDTLATSYALSQAIKKMKNVDLIICGKQASDGDTAQVGPSMAERLGIPHTTCVRKIEEIGSRSITCRRMTETGYEILELPLPSLITFVKEINTPRLPTLKNLLLSRNSSIEIWNSTDIDADKSKCGLKGSPTQVVKTFIPQQNTQCEFLCGTVQEQAVSLAKKLTGI